MVNSGDLHPQQPIVRDFLGLGNLASSSSPADVVLDDHHRQPHQHQHQQHPHHFRGQDVHGWSSAGFSTLAPALPNFVHSDYTCLKNPVWNEHMNMQKVFKLGNTHEDKYMEGSADSCAVVQTPHQLPGIMPGTGGIPNRAQSRPFGYANQSGAQLTIFYGGNVNVYDNVSSGKAQALMQMAATGNTLPADLAVLAGGEHQARNNHLHFNAQMCQAQYAADEASQSSPPVNRYRDCPPPSTPSSDSSPIQPMVPKALPLARKASLARFLEKRKERMQMMAPYLMKNAILPGNAVPAANCHSTFPRGYTDYASMKSAFLASAGEYAMQPGMMPSGIHHTSILPAEQ